jgi:hypothetical protein
MKTAFNFTFFKTLYTVGGTMAQELALANGIKLPVIQLWIAQLSQGGAK